MWVRTHSYLAFPVGMPSGLVHVLPLWDLCIVSMCCSYAAHISMGCCDHTSRPRLSFISVFLVRLSSERLHGLCPLGLEGSRGYAEAHLSDDGPSALEQPRSRVAHGLTPRAAAPLRLDAPARGTPCMGSAARRGRRLPKSW